MRVGLNATCFNTRPSGANQRFRTVYGALMRRNPGVAFVLFEPADCQVGSWFADIPNLETRRTPLPSARRLTRQWAGLRYWRDALARERLDLFESFNLPIVAAPCPHLLTIHDLHPIRHGGGIAARLATDIVMRHALARTDRIIVVSQAVRRELLLTYPAARVEVVYNGVDASAFGHETARELAAVRARWGLPEAFALTVGHLEARKNIGLLIDAVACLRDRGVALPLALVGRDGGQRDALRAQIERLRLASLVTVIEDADDAAVRALYTACRLVIVPSRYEGFGIPLVEAMAAQRPVVTSDIAVFRELTGDDGAYFPVDDPTATADMLARLWTDATARTRLVAVGQAQLGRFAIDGLADRIATIYADLVPYKMSAIRARAAANE